jgi:hypothetical protein
VQQQIVDLEALIDQLVATQQLQAKDAEGLDQMITDVGNLVMQGKQSAAQDELAAMRRKNDVLLTSGKTTSAGHAAVQERIDQLAVAISGQPSA